MSTGKPAQNRNSVIRLSATGMVLTLLAACATPNPPLMPPPPSPTSSPSSGPSSPSPSSAPSSQPQSSPQSGSGSGQSGRPSGPPPSGGAPGSPGSPGSQSPGSGQDSGTSGSTGSETPGGASTPGDASSPGGEQANQPSTGPAGGEPTDLEILEPEPPSSSSSSASASDAGGGEAGGEGEMATEEAVAESGGESGGAEGSDQSAGGGQEGGGEPGQPGGGQPGQPGGGQPGGSASDEWESVLAESVRVFENGMQQEIIIVASSMPEGGFEQVESSGGESGEMGGDPSGIEQTIILVEEGVTELPTGSSSASNDSASGVIQPGQEGPEVTDPRSGDNKIRKLVLAAVPEDVGDGSDDDVVARQIREAATNEKDPVLREKLWEEYRNYKKTPRRKRF